VSIYIYIERFYETRLPIRANALTYVRGRLAPAVCATFMFHELSTELLQSLTLTRLHPQFTPIPPPRCHTCARTSSHDRKPVRR